MMLKFKWETEFKNTEIGGIPREWDTRKIKEIGKVITLATNNGANRIYGIRFDSSETENLRKEAIAKEIPTTPTGKYWRLLAKLKIVILPIERVEARAVITIKFMW